MPGIGSKEKDMISVIIPFYNDEKYVKECLDSLRKQTYKDFECLCLDDGSIDGTLEILNSYAKVDSRFKIFQNFHKGPGWERNFGVSQANGEFIAFMDHDDWVNPEWLEKLYITLKITQSDVSYCSNADFYQNTGMYENYFFKKKELQISELSETNKCNCLTNKYFAPWRRLVKKSIIEQNNIKFAEGNFKFDDVLFTQELIENVSKVSFCNEILYFHRIFDDSITGKGMRNHDIFFEHLDTAQKVWEYASENKRNGKLMIRRMFPLLITYFKYVETTDSYYRRLNDLLKRTNQSISAVFYTKITYVIIKLKRKVKKIKGLFTC